MYYKSSVLDIEQYLLPNVTASQFLSTFENLFSLDPDFVRVKLSSYLIDPSHYSRVSLIVMGSKIAYNSKDYIYYVSNKSVEEDPDFLTVTRCQVTCEIGCEFGCESTCESTCESGCESSCESGCESNCESSCETGVET